MKTNNNDLPPRVLKWAVSAINPNATVTGVERLKGSTSSTLHCISLQVSMDTKDTQQFVIRQFDNKDWLLEEPDLAIHEARSLQVASQAAVNTPEIIAFDKNGEACGIPAVVMSLLDGEVDLQPANRSKWLDGLAASLVKIHAVEPVAFPFEYFTYNNIETLEIPTWSSIPEKWKRAIEIIKSPQPKYRECFIHRDYHPANVLWKNDLVSGVVDWVNACRGPAGIDVGHCRVNLAMLYGVETADEFLSAYQQFAAGTFEYDTYWDLLSVIDILSGPPKVYEGWAAFGVIGLTDNMMEQRLDNYINRLLERV